MSLSTWPYVCQPSVISHLGRLCTMRLCAKINKIYLVAYTFRSLFISVLLIYKSLLCYRRLVTWPSGEYNWRTPIKVNDEKNVQIPFYIVFFSEPILHLWFQSWHRKKKKEIGKITCRDTLCGREMIISVYILNPWQNSKSYPDAGKGEHFLHVRNNTQRTHPSVCCKKMSKSHVYQENSKC